jgi:hypothetical protein
MSSMTKITYLSKVVESPWSKVKMSPFGEKEAQKSKHREGRQSEQTTNNERKRAKPD